MFFKKELYTSKNDINLYKSNNGGFLRKEYKVVTIKGGKTVEKLVNSAQEKLDEMASQGWEFKFLDNILWIFERENK
ncbi:MAG: DUF4177 domain-containing protein [Candidatus Lokiarchaeota archaeon]|nr:DUF4177 domain-containing protein [Candidatus Lokiarchaeota archaeon]